MGAGGIRLRLQEGWQAWGWASICLSQWQHLSAVQSAGPARPRGPRTQPAAVCDQEIEAALGARGHREGRQRCGALTTSARTCPRRGELAQPGAGRSRDGLSPCLSPPLCGPEDWAPQCQMASLGDAELTEGPPGPGWEGLEVVGPEQDGECWACRALGSVPGMRVRKSGQGHISSGRQQPAPASLPALGPPCGWPA